MPTVLERCRTELKEARRELAAVDEALGEFYCSVRGIDGEADSFYLDHGVHLMRAELERLRCDHSVFNWDKQENGDWICQGCGGLVPSHNVTRATIGEEAQCPV